MRSACDTIARWAKSQRVPLLLFILAFFAYAYFCQGTGWNSGVRFSQVRSLVEGGTFAINDYARYEVSRTPNGPQPRRVSLGPVAQGDLEKVGLLSLDVSAFEGRLYPNKPPGATILAVPGYAIGLLVTKACGAHPDDWWPLTLSAYLARVLSVGLAGALTVALTFIVIRRLTPQLSPRLAVLSALTLGLATPLFPCSTLFLDHVPAACALLAAFAALIPEADADRPTLRRLIWAGFFCGLAVVTSYLASLGVLALLLYAGSFPGTVGRRLQCVGWMALGGLPCAVLLSVFHAACFGSVLANANTYQYQAFADEGQAFGMFGTPSLEAFHGITISPYRGLFFSAPVLLLAPVGAPVLWRDGRRSELAILLLIPGVFFFAVSSFNGWHSGSMIMSRYLVPILPFLVVLLAHALVQRRIAILAGVAGAISGVAMLLATAVQPSVPWRVQDPFFNYLIPIFTGGNLEFSGIPFQVPGPISAGHYGPSGLVLAGPASESVLWTSFNLGEAVWFNSRFSLLPFLLVVAAGAWWLLRWTRLPSPAPRERIQVGRINSA